MIFKATSGSVRKLAELGATLRCCCGLLEASSALGIVSRIPAMYLDPPMYFYLGSYGLYWRVFRVDWRVVGWSMALADGSFWFTRTTDKGLHSIAVHGAVDCLLLRRDGSGLTSFLTTGRRRLLIDFHHPSPCLVITMVSA